MIEELRLSTASDGVKFNNVIGRLPKKTVLAKEAIGDSDGVVSVESAKYDQCESEVFVPEEHSHVHQHAACIYEVQRILLANLANMHRIEGRTIPVIPFADDKGQIQQLLPTVQSPVSGARVAEQVAPVVPPNSSSRRR